MSRQTTRRHFVEILPFAGLAILAACTRKEESNPETSTNPPPALPDTTQAPASASAPTTSTGSMVMLDEHDPAAMALGYVHDAARAEKVKFKNYAIGSECSNCISYLGPPGSTAGGCKIFPGKNVAAKGWCSAWAKKA